MSGPKVVNIEALRRQQRRACNALLHDLTTAVDECLRLQDGDAAATNEFQERREALFLRLNGLRATENWGELLPATSAHRDFYRSEADGLRRRATDRRASAFRREHNLRQAAAQLHAELRRLPATPSRDAALQQLATAQDTTSLQSAVTQAAGLVSAMDRDSTDIANADRLRKVAALYADPPGPVVESPTRPEAERDPDEARLERCWSLLGEMETLAPLTSVDSWKQKAGSITTARATERPLLLDSLVLELTSHLRAFRAQQAATAVVQSVLAALVNVSAPECGAWRDKLSAAREAQVGAEEALALAASARAWLDEEIRREDVREQRAAVLRVLTGLGYEVREGMVAAWTEQGRVIVHKPEESVYGLELSAPPTGSAFQVRVVAVASQGRSKQRDLEVEQAWCGDFARLQSLLAADGFPTKLAQAQAPGAIPIKTVPAKVARTDDRRVPSNRTLPTTDAR